MILQLNPNINPAQQASLEKLLHQHKFSLTEVKTQYGGYLIANGSKEIDLRRIGSLPFVNDVHRVTDTYKLVSAKWKLGHSVIQIGDDTDPKKNAYIGNGHFQIMAGPCSIEGEEQIRETVAHLKRNGIKMMRGGVYKPRSSPYSFRGLGLEGLQLFSTLCKENDIKIITEVMQPSQIDAMMEYVDVFQVGSRNALNYNLLEALGKVDKPVMLKRGFSGTLDELLLAAEYIFSHGNERIMLCERGIRTFEKAYRNTLDLNAVALLKEKTHLPVVVDPSHGIGIRKFVPPMALAGIMAGADGLIIEVHHQPEQAFSDGQQTLNFQEAESLYYKAKAARQLVG